MTRDLEGRVVRPVLVSRCLRGNPLGDPAERVLPVYLPPGYDGSRARYPVLYALAGFTGRGAQMLHVTGWGESLEQRLNRLHAEGRIGPMIVVFPDCFTRYGGSQYLDSAAVGDYSTYLTDEIVPAVDATFRTLARPRHRGVFGKSSGGFGAMWHGMQRPDVFGAVACHSGDMGFEYCYFPDFPKLLAQCERHGGLTGFLRAFARAPRKTGEMIGAMNMLAMAACYAPNPRRRPLRFDPPFDEQTGEVDPAVWRRWLAFDPLRRIGRSRRALRRLRLLFVDCGRRDEFNLLWSARQFHARLRAAGIRHVYEEFDDGHMDVSYRFDRSLPLLWQAVRPGAPGPRRRAAARPGRRRS